MRSFAVVVNIYPSCHLLSMAVNRYLPTYLPTKVSGDLHFINTGRLPGFYNLSKVGDPLKAVWIINTGMRDGVKLIFYILFCRLRLTFVVALTIVKHISGVDIDTLIECWIRVNFYLYLQYFLTNTLINKNPTTKCLSNCLGKNRILAIVDHGWS